MFPLLSSPKSFPSASDYLWLQLVSRQPSGPMWRLRSLLLPQTALREGCSGEREARDTSVLGRQTSRSSAAVQTHVKEKGTMQMSRLSSAVIMGTVGQRKSFYFPLLF